jgi:hypothetical protein
MCVNLLIVPSFIEDKRIYTLSTMPIKDSFGGGDATLFFISIEIFAEEKVKDNAVYTRLESS